ncbi:hypothetical protein ACIQWA_31630 [Kitasatospora sp. NPDC098652]|uniref:hypothetical protein n=1 Tax=Kitasatospora sp. NPDC098652 TaxID=3364095 RepID=UPI00380A2521
MRKLTAAVALATAVTALAAGTTGTAAAAVAAVPVPAAAPAQHLALHGWTLLNEYGPGPNPGERLTAQVDARTVDGRTRGHAVVQHVFEKDGTIRAEFDVDCLTVDGAGAVTVTGPISRMVLTPLGGEPRPFQPGQHPEAGLTFYPADGQGERRVGWQRTDPAMHTEVTKCGAVPADFWVIGGGTVLHR